MDTQNFHKLNKRYSLFFYNFVPKYWHFHHIIMKIFYIYTALTTVGGADRVLIQKANWLADHGYDITIVTESQAGKPITFPLSKNVKHVDLGVDFDKEYGHILPIRAFIYFKLMREYKKRLQKFIINGKPDFVINTLGRELGILTSMKDSSIKIGETHTTQYHLRNFHLMEQQGCIYKLIAKYSRKKQISLAKKLKAIVLLTPQDKEDWQGITTTYVIPNSIPVYPKEASTLENKRAIVVGRYNDAKGYEYLIEAWKIVHQKHPDWTLDIFGSGEMHDNVKMWIEENNLTDTMIMNEPTNNIMEEYHNSSICIISSRYEGFSMVMLEAMASGVPCVSFDCPFGPRNIIRNGEDGILVEYLNSQALADNICKLIENTALRKELGAAARINILRFTQDEVMKKWTTLFDTIIKKKLTSLLTHLS